MSIRALREWYPGATYHIMARGIRRMEIFQDDMDYQVFLMLLKKVLEEQGGILHAFCLMTNHIHLLLETGECMIGDWMKQLEFLYAIYYNRRHGYKGHLFENRYKSCLVKEDSYFIQTSRYIHLNPVRARMVAHPEDYPWSSYKTLIGMNDDGITSTAYTYGYFPNTKAQGYRAFVEDKGKKYMVTEEEIHRQIEGDEEWLPW